MHWNWKIVEDIKENQDNGKIAYVSFSKDNSVKMAILPN